MVFMVQSTSVNDSDKLISPEDTATLTAFQLGIDPHYSTGSFPPCSGACMDIIDFNV